MHFIPEIHEHDVDAAVSECIDIVGQDTWKWRMDWIVQQLRANPLLTEFILERYPIEIAYATYMRNKVAPGSVPEYDSSAATRRLATFAAAIVSVHHRLTPFGQKQLKGKLIHGLTTNEGLASLVHELVTAVHLMRKGYDVHFSDLENGGGFDLLATREGIEVEVECKLASGDLGRAVHRRRALDLFYKLEPMVKSLMKGFRGGCSYRIFVPMHLGGSIQQLSEIHDALKAAILMGNDVFECAACSIHRQEFSLDKNPFEVNVNELDQNSLHGFTKKNLGIGNQNCIFLGTLRENCIVLSIESRRRDNMLDSVFRTLRDSARRQCSGNRPAVLCTKFYDLSPDALAAVGKDDKSSDAYPSALRIAASRFLLRHAPTHLHSIAFVSNTDESRHRSQRGSILKTEYHSEGIAYFFRNPKNHHYGDSRLSLF